MRGSVGFACLVAAFAAATVVIGWWALPILGAVWGAIARDRPRPVSSAALAAALGWLVILAWASTQGPVGSVARQVGAVMSLPGPVLLLVVLVFAAAVSSAAAEIGRFIAVTARRRTADRTS
jgi:hypothetical protein